MSDKTSLGDRLKRYEQPYKAVLPRRTYTLLRVDGRAFHSYLRGAQKPFDYEFMTHMDQVAVALCKEVGGAVFAYVQSDEITVLYTDFASHQTEPWFGGSHNKQVSISAAVASATMTRLRPEHRPALFDSRVFTLSDPVEVANCFVWRQRDAVRNSITMAAQAHFSHKELHRVTTDQMQQKLWAERQVNWDQYPDGAKRGRVVQRVVTPTVVNDAVGAAIGMRSAWVPTAAPHFKAEPDTWLADMIPAMPSLTTP